MSKMKLSELRAIIREELIKTMITELNSRQMVNEKLDTTKPDSSK